MERVKGDVFEEHGVKMEVSEGSCLDCAYFTPPLGNAKGCGNKHIKSGPCLKEVRAAKDDVIFKKKED